MLWLKAFHIIFVVTWFAGLFYLPRLFVYAAQHPEAELQPVFRTMQRKLLGITHVGGALAVGFGLALILLAPSVYLAMGWLHAKLALVAVLIGYHVWCARLVAAFREGRNRHSHVWYRWFNEAPALLLVAIVLLAILKPF
ncbi:CopD family protein [Wenzhouxiangella sp. XN79A]|uniref:CopD family protein n=1 Tax=Wenzhouxiangella sp. XN79A TaxID=2724193 RepID=UPI00144AF856|nr:CopD family protein [Wenzhouxiangella sp. XN79A]NKI35678.1 CopD family protein [Wenzhouxiangella sp. XN79A]